jgi:hypothetical protein
MQLSSILYYLRAELTATRPITDTAECNYIMDNHNIKLKTNYRQTQEEKHITAEKYKNKQTSKQTNKQANKQTNNVIIIIIILLTRI